MAFTVFKPNKLNKGFMLSLNYDERNKAFFASFTKQVGWNEDSATGSFKDGEKINCKLSDIEAAGIVSAIRTRGAVQFFHKTEDRTMQIFFDRAFDLEKDEKGQYRKVDGKYVETKNQIGFKFYLIVNKERIGLNLTYPEAELLMEFLRYNLAKSFQIQDQEDAERRLENQKKQDKQPSKTGAKQLSSKKYEATQDVVDEVSDETLVDDVDEDVVF